MCGVLAWCQPICDSVTACKLSIAQRPGRMARYPRRPQAPIKRTISDSLAWKADEDGMVLDVLQFYGSDAFKDCQLVANDGTVLHCHRVILAGASDVFEAMFTAEGMQEAESCTAQIAADKHMLDLVLQFIYGKTVDVSLVDVVAVYQLLDQYGMSAAAARLSSIICKEMKGFDAQALCHVVHQAYELGYAARSIVSAGIAAMRSNMIDVGPEWISNVQEFQQWHIGLLQHVLADHPMGGGFLTLRAKVGTVRVTYAVAAAAWVNAAATDRLQHWEGLMQQLELKQATAAEVQKIRDVYPELLQLPGGEAALQEAADKNSTVLASSDKHQRT